MYSPQPWPNWLTELPAVRWFVIMGDLSSSPKGVYWTRPEAFRAPIQYKMTSYQYRKSHCGDKRVLRPSYLHNGISYSGKMTSLYWIKAQNRTTKLCCTQHARSSHENFWFFHSFPLELAWFKVLLPMVLMHLKPLMTQCHEYYFAFIKSLVHWFM